MTLLETLRDARLNLDLMDDYCPKCHDDHALPHVNCYLASAIQAAEKLEALADEWEGRNHDGGFSPGFRRGSSFIAAELRAIIGAKA